MTDTPDINVETQGDNRKPTNQIPKPLWMIGKVFILLVVITLAWNSCSSILGGKKPISDQMVEEMAGVYLVNVEAVAVQQGSSMVAAIRQINPAQRRAIAGQFVDLMLETLPPDKLNYDLPATEKYVGWYERKQDVKRVRDRMVDLLVEMARE